jgi:hypothetical protein
MDAVRQPGVWLEGVGLSADRDVLDLQMTHASFLGIAKHPLAGQQMQPHHRTYATTTPGNQEKTQSYHAPLRNQMQEHHGYTKSKGQMHSTYQETSTNAFNISRNKYTATKKQVHSNQALTMPAFSTCRTCCSVHAVTTLCIAMLLCVLSSLAHKHIST